MIPVPCPECIQCVCRKLQWHCWREEDAAILGFLPDRRSSITELDGNISALKSLSTTVTVDYSATNNIVYSS